MPETKVPMGSWVFPEATAGRLYFDATKKTDEGSTSNRLFIYALWYVASRGYEFEAGVAGEIFDMAHSASREIYSGVAPTGLEPSDANLAVELKTKLAEAELAAFIDLMISASPGTRPGHITIVQETAFLSAKSKLCPLWLIC